MLCLSVLCLSAGTPSLLANPPLIKNKTDKWVPQEKIEVKVFSIVDRSLFPLKFDPAKFRADLVLVSTIAALDEASHTSAPLPTHYTLPKFIVTHPKAAAPSPAAPTSTTEVALIADTVPAAKVSYVDIDPVPSVEMLVSALIAGQGSSGSAPEPAPEPTPERVPEPVSEVSQETPQFVAAAEYKLPLPPPTQALKVDAAPKGQTEAKPEVKTDQSRGDEGSSVVVQPAAPKKQTPAVGKVSPSSNLAAPTSTTEVALIADTVPTAKVSYVDIDPVPSVEMLVSALIAGQGSSGSAPEPAPEPTPERVPEPVSEVSQETPQFVAAAEYKLPLPPPTQALKVDAAPKGQTEAKPEVKTDQSRVDEGSSVVVQPVAPKKQTPAVGKVFASSNLAAEKKNAKQGYVINFNNISMIEYIGFVGNISRTNFTYNEEDLQFTVTIKSKEPMTVAEVMTVLLQELRVRGLSFSREGNSLLIYRNAQLATLAEVISKEQNNLTSDQRTIVTRVFHLANAMPGKMLALIQPMLSTQAAVEASDETRHLIVTDIVGNVDKVVKLLESLDMPNVSFEVGVYVAQNIFLENLVQLTEKIMKPLAGDNPLVLVPQAAADAIYVVSTPYLVQRTIALMRTLDIVTNKPQQAPVGSVDQTGFFVYKLQYHRGDAIYASLQAVGANMAKNGQVNPGLVNAIASLQWVPTSNSLIFTGPPDVIDKVKELVKSLDVPLRQVFIEVLVIETSLDNSLNYGVDWGVAVKQGKVGGNTLNFAAGNLAATTANMTTLSSPASINNPYNVGILGTMITKGGNTFTTLGALVKALQTDRDTKILMNPKIITEDNHQAVVFVGTSIPIQMNSANVTPVGGGTQTTTSTQYQQVGTRLVVRPVLGSGDLITLDILQEISSASSNSNAQNASLTPVISLTTTNTRVHVRNKQFLVISGMIQEQKSYVRAGLPCLGGMPGIGAAFSETTEEMTKTNIMIFLRPYIVSSEEEMDSLTNAQGKEFKKSEQTPGFTKGIDTVIQSTEPEGPPPAHNTQ